MSYCETLDTVDFILLLLIPLWIPHGTLVIGVLPRQVEMVLKGLFREALTMPVDKKEKPNKLIDRILDLQKTLDDLTSRMDGGWKVPRSGLIKNTLPK